MTVIVNCDDQKTVNTICTDLTNAMFDLSTIKVADQDSERTKADVLMALARISEKLDVLGIKYFCRPGAACRQTTFNWQGGC